MISTDLHVFKENHVGFLSDVMEVLIAGKEHFTRNHKENLNDINSLKIQLKILSRGELNSEEDIENYLTQAFIEEDWVSFEEYGSENTSERMAENSEYTFVISTLLQSALQWRRNYIKALDMEIEELLKADNQSLHIVTLCMENLFLEGEERRKENTNFQEALDAFQNEELMKPYLDYLESISHFNSESLSFIDSELDRLTNTFENLQSEGEAVFTSCEQDILQAVHKREEGIENMTEELSYLTSMGMEDTQVLSDLKLIFRSGIDERTQEITLFQNDFENWTAETETLHIISTCLHHLQSSFEKRKIEKSKIKGLLDFLESENDMSSLLYSPALESLMEATSSEIEWIEPEINKLSSIQAELEMQAKNILEECREVFCMLLETFKIEIDAITYDLENLQEMESVKVELINEKDTELIVNFKDLFLAVFNAKKHKLERNFHKKLIYKDIEKMKHEIVNCLKQSNTIPDFESIEEQNSTSLPENNQTSNLKTTHNVGKINNNVSNYKGCLEYLRTKKNVRKVKMEEVILKKIHDLESETASKKEVDSKASSSHGNGNEKAVEEDKKTERFVNKVYEIKVQEIEVDISVKRNKISNVIKQRRVLMDDLIKTKKNEMIENVFSKEKQINYELGVVKDEESQVICCLKDIFNDIVQLKNAKNYTLKNKNYLDKYLSTELQEKPIWVNIENLFDVALSIREEEFKITKQFKLKDIEKCSLVMKKEAIKREGDAYKKLEEALEKYRQQEKTKALELSRITKKDDEKTLQDYVICDDEIFPDIRSFENFISGFNLPFDLHKTDSLAVNSNIHPFGTSHLPFMQPYAYALHGFVGQLLKSYQTEMKNLSEVLYCINYETGSMKSIKTTHSLSHNNIPSSLPIKSQQKGTQFDISAVLNNNTGMLMLGSYMHLNCEIALNLGREFGLVYFEKTENIKKWLSPLPNVKEVSIDVGLKEFGNDSCIDILATPFDLSVSTIPFTSSKFESFISDTGLMEQIRFAFMELHHQHLLCRTCEMNNVFKDIGLSFENIHNFLSAKSISEMLQLMPITSGTPTLDDVAIAQYASKVILIRGALLTSICLCSILNRLEKNDIKIITNSLFIEKYDDYQVYLKTFLSVLSPNKMVEFLFSDSSCCSFGVALAASVVSNNTNNNPEYYLLELKQRFKQGNTVFSVKQFLQLVENPDTHTNAVLLAKFYKKDLSFDVPLSVVWAYYFMNEKFLEAEKLYKKNPVTIEHVNPIICKKIRSSENFTMWKQYTDFLKRNSLSQNMKITAYRCLFDLLVSRNMYSEAISVIQELEEMDIPLSNLQLSSLNVLHNFCSKPSSRAENIPLFALPTKETWQQ